MPCSLAQGGSYHRGVEIEVVSESGAERLEELEPLLDAVRAHDHHEPLGEHKFLDLVHGGPDCFRGIVARSDGDLVGYGHLSRHGAKHWGLELVIHPARRSQGVGTKLAEEARRIVSADGGGKMHLWVFKPTDADDEMAEKIGLQRGRDLLHMRVDLPLDVAPHLPEGVRMRSFIPGRDEDAWLDVNNRAFASHPEQGGWDRKTLNRRMSETWFDPQGLLLADSEDGLAGFCWTKLNPECGEIYVIGVDPRFQGTGLGKALTIAGLDSIAKRGVSHGCLYVDSAQTAPMALYEKLGFVVDHVDRAYVGEIGV